ncbi:peroxiredoxin [Cellulomonas sp. PhB143]|uniref:peroxiredoxin n=1 Tax=Cellulomonas sp. PhB143 TaxID=2485186 RepID=UPI000FAB5FA5|nr:peroxiredoxin [Cellulomonas sp. PhB143]ROS75356.1 peroxiredoxin [Cellulomonas sp. PhB143]
MPPTPATPPTPVDDGATDHLRGALLPAITLPATDGTSVPLDRLGPGRVVVYAYPLTSRPGTPPPDGWDSIPGARGCTPEACAFRDHHRDLLAAGATAVHGLSTQPTDYQREVVDRLHLPFSMLSDDGGRLTAALDLPTFDAGGERLLRRFTLVVRDGVVEHVFYPVFPPDAHAEQVLAWLREHP